MLTEHKVEWSSGVLTSRPKPLVEWHPPHAGQSWPLGKGQRQPVLFVPTALPQHPVPLLVLLHGAGGTASDILPLVQDDAEARKFLVLAPQSAGPTWDVIRAAYGPDVAIIDKALATVFDTFAVDASLVAAGGFSDGASYALSLGITNGDLFSSVLAYSPGFLVPSRKFGRPSIFVSHGREDNILSIDRCSRRIVPALQNDGYNVRYEEFEGGHLVPKIAVERSLDVFLPPD